MFRENLNFLDRPVHRSQDRVGPYNSDEQLRTNWPYYERNGLTKEEVTDLGNYHIQALTLLKQYGLTAQILRDNRWLNTPDHCDVLIARIKHRNMKVADAIDSLDGLSRSELCDIRQAELPKMPGWK